MNRDENEIGNEHAHEVAHEGLAPSWESSKSPKPGGAGAPTGPGPSLGSGPVPDSFEAQLRELLAEDAKAIAPSPAPCASIQRQAHASTRRRAAATGVALVTLAAVPAGAYVFGRADGSRFADTVGTASSSPSTPPTSSPPSPSPSPSPSGPAGPFTPGQLADGITLTQAADGLDTCITDDAGRGSGAGVGADLGSAADYRILLAMNSTGDDNAPGNGIFVVAVKEKPKQTRIICNVKGGQTSGINTSVGSDAYPGAGLVIPDMNGGTLYKQTIITSSSGWKLPFRWGSIGTVDSSVAKVTVTYGARTSEAALDHGWFAATGILEQQVSTTPRIKGYDTGGKLVYDSDQDLSYEKTLP